ncbi:MAG: 3-dehydroquinate synthase [Chlamydiota bacterium]
MTALTLSFSFQRVTQIWMQSGFLFSDAAVATLRSKGERFALFCDEPVAALWGQKWYAFLQGKGLDVSLFTIPAGEAEKNRGRKAHLEDLLFAQQFGRDSCFIAMGGGVITDLVGFLAATFCRGVPLVNVPTTLLGMVDAAIGGKTGVDTPMGKNLVGAFYPAEHLFIDLALLETLPAKDRVNGFAEIIKYALIYSSALFERLSPQSKDLESIVRECIQIKKEVAEEDFEEKGGKRRILNFGHTIGHAIELLEEFQVSHGEAVAMGMCVESYLSMRTGLLSQGDFERIISCVRAFPFQLRLSARVKVDGMIEALALDKKAAKGIPRFVLLDGIGSCAPFQGTYCTVVPSELLNEALHWMREQFAGGTQ